MSPRAAPVSDELLVAATGGAASAMWSVVALTTSVRVRARRVGDEVLVTVADDGPGIPADELPHLTDRFFRGGDPNTRPTRGLGLGLAFVADVLEAHGGRLDVQSIYGSGSSFTFILPATVVTAGEPSLRA